MRKSFLALGAVLLTATVFTATPAQAAPPTPSGVKVVCGQAVAANMTAYLASDLHCTISISDGATLNLNGYALSGLGTAPGRALQYVSGGGGLTKDISVTNGTIRDWSGVWNLIDGPGLKLTHVTVSNSKTVVSGFHAFLTAESSTFTGNDAVVNGSIISASLTGSTFTGNKRVVVGDTAGAITVTGSTFRKNGTAIDCAHQSLSVTHSRFVGNTSAVAAKGCFGAKITDNTFTGNVSAVTTAPLRQQCGCEAPGDTQARPDQVLRNRFLNNKTAIDATRSGTYSSNLVDRNTRGFTSLAIPDTLGLSLIVTMNTFTRNGDGVYATNPVSLGHNIAVRNTGYGIYAPHAIDLGGNIALHNGKTPQCTGVICAVS